MFKWEACMATAQAKWAAAPQNKQNDVRPPKTQISLGIHLVWSVFAVHSKSSQGPKLSSCGKQTDQIGQLPRLIQVFGGFVSVVMLQLRGTFPVS